MNRLGKLADKLLDHDDYNTYPTWGYIYGLNRVFNAPRLTAYRRARQARADLLHQVGPISRQERMERH